MAKKKKSTLGAIAFIIGLVVVIVSAIINPGEVSSGIAMVLGIIGLIVGLMNVVEKEVLTYLVAAIAFIVSAGGLNTVLGSIALKGFFTAFFQGTVIFVAPSAAIVALRAIYDIAKD